LISKLMLNILLSFAQFEREVTSERIRDKIAASKKKGMWMGGTTPLGYERIDKKLVINVVEAEAVRFIFEEYYRTCSLVEVANNAHKKGYRTKVRFTEDGKKTGGNKITNSSVHNILKNQIYLGKIHHKGEYFQGEHKPIITPELWNQVRSVMGKDSIERKNSPVSTKMPGILKGIIFDNQGNALTPTFTRKSNKIYRYYVNTYAIKHGYDSCDIKLFPAEEIENFIIAKIRQLATTPELISKVHVQAKKQDATITAEYIRNSLKDFNNVWEHLFPIEKSRIIKLLIRKITVGVNGVQITFHPNGLLNLCQQLNSKKEKVA